MHLAALVKRYKKRISLALSLVIIENAAWIVEPFLFGLVIDGIIDKAYVDPQSNFVLPLLMWIGAFLINSGVGSLRRSLDTRIYLNIFQILPQMSQRNQLKNIFQFPKLLQGLNFHINISHSFNTVSRK